MAKVNVEFNYQVAEKELGLEVKVGRKNVILKNEKFYIESNIMDLEKGQVNAVWITTYRGSKMKYQDVVALLEGLNKVEKVEEKPLTKFQMFKQMVMAINEFQGLNDQEIKIVSLVKEGKEVKEVSQIIGLAESTIKDKINGRKGKPGIMEKLSA